ncbi:hypothetical protein EYE40_02550 [Glaciihabitans arcticus]|uniref:Cupin domain-containing protein n=1 Tax=Glaciihabitans arcticus TaxID=2668039 RepID=A0A4Q9GNR4_9MICO|nr:hypothetical protein [Glaciihabitans arcticus]TBN56366.1 hypothetical protein EYE40_02550 [Glaciihabitans arcticus]
MIEHRITSRSVGALGSSGVDMSFLLGPAVSSINTVRILAGGGLGEHPAETWQVFYVLSGLVEVTGSDDTHDAPRTIVLEPEQAVQWAPGEQRSSRALVDSLVVLIEATEQIPSARPL